MNIKYDASGPHGRKTVNGGFSLIELFAVISIIAVLSSIAVVNISGRAKLAKDSAVKNNLMVLRGAVGRYYAVNSRFPASLEALRGVEVRNAYLKWEGANASGAIAYDPARGAVFLVDDAGRPPAARDLAGVAYSEY